MSALQDLYCILLHSFVMYMESRNARRRRSNVAPLTLSRSRTGRVALVYVQRLSRAPHRAVLGRCEREQPEIPCIPGDAGFWRRRRSAKQCGHLSQRTLDPHRACTGLACIARCRWGRLWPWTMHINIACGELQAWSRTFYRDSAPSSRNGVQTAAPCAMQSPRSCA